MALTPVTQRICEANCHETEAAYQASPFCQAYLPRSKPHGKTWHRTNGRALLEIESGRMADMENGGFQNIGLPYGPTARIVLIYIITEAIRWQTPIVNLTRSHTKFSEKIYGYQNGRTKAELRKQILALGKATIRMAVPTKDGHTEHEMRMARSFTIHYENGKSVWPGTLRLTDDYFNAIIKHAVPLNYNHVAALRHNALALDIYSWLVHRTYRLGKPVTITWQALREQFAPEYGLKQFRQQWRRTVREVTPLIDVDCAEESRAGQPHGITIRPGTLPLPHV